MYDLNNTIKKWNERLKAARLNKGYSQLEVAKRLTHDYPTPTQQKTVSSWERVGDTSGKRKIGFPRMENALELADLYDLDVGYLLGETDFETFDHEKACENFAFSKSTGDRLKNIFNSTGVESSLIESHQAKQRRVAFSFLVNSECFEDFLDSIFTLYDAHRMKVSAVGEGLDNIYTKEELDEAYRVFNSPESPYDLDLDKKTIEILDAIDMSIDVAHDEEIDRTDAINREEYFLQKSFFRLTDSLNENMDKSIEKQKSCPVAQKILEEKIKSKEEFIQKLQAEVSALTSNFPKK